MTTYSCGCVNTPDIAGVMRCVSKCEFHVASLAKERTEADGSGLAYYERLGSIKDGVPQCATYLAELTDAIGDIPPGNNSPALEIGCGVSPYAAHLRAIGYRYLGIEPSKWAADFMRSMRFPVLSHPWPVAVTQPVSLILCAHALEHMEDAPGGLLAMCDALEPGGWLVLIVPDDTDMTNPDHWWFFSEVSLRELLAISGFTVERLAIRKRIERENFIYVLAAKR